MSKINCSGSTKEQVMSNFEKHFNEIFGDLTTKKRTDGDFYRNTVPSVQNMHAGSVIKAASGR